MRGPAGVPVRKVLLTGGKRVIDLISVRAGGTRAEGEGGLRACGALLRASANLGPKLHGRAHAHRGVPAHHADRAAPPAQRTAGSWCYHFYTRQRLPSMLRNCRRCFMVAMRSAPSTLSVFASAVCTSSCRGRYSSLKRPHALHAGSTSVPRSAPASQVRARRRIGMARACIRKNGGRPAAGNQLSRSPCHLARCKLRCCSGSPGNLPMPRRLVVTCDTQTVVSCLQGALQDLDKAVDLDRSSAPALRMRGQCKRRLKDYQASLLLDH